MEVFLVPAGPTRHALYCEADFDAGADAAPAASRSWWGRAKEAFRRAVDEGDAASRGLVVDESRGRLRRWITRKIAEAVAEGRLLWRLRHETTATLVHPDSMEGGRALELARSEFAADYARHRRWLGIDSLVVVITGPVFFFVPGPNVLSWYFTFRAVGHFFSMRGAKQGLSVTRFETRASHHLTDVAAALSGDPAARADRVARAAAALELERLPQFLDRVAT